MPSDPAFARAERSARSTSIAVVLVLLALPLLPNAVRAQDSKAVDEARALMARRTDPTEIARTLAATYRLQGPGVVRVLAAAEMGAVAAAGAAVEAFRAEPATVVDWLIAAGYGAEDVMAAATRLRVEPGTVLKLFRRARVPADRAARATRVAESEPTRGARLLVGAGWKAVEATPALIAAYRLGADDAASAFRKAELRASDIAEGLAEVAGGPRQALESLDRGGYDFRDIRRVALHTFQYTAVEWAEHLKEGGADVITTATSLRDDYGLGPVEGGEILSSEPVWYSIQKTARAFREVWGLDVHEAYAAASEIFEGSVWSALTGGGYELPAPRVHRYRTIDPRPGHGGEWLENVGVVDPSSVGPMAPEDHDGRVQVLLGVRGLDPLDARIGTTTGQIVQRIPHDFADDGTSYPGEWVEFEFHGFESGSLQLEHLGRTYSVPVVALGYHLVEGDVLTGSLETLDVRMGDPRGEGSLTVEEREWEGQTLPGTTSEFAVPEMQQLGIVAELLDLRSSDVTTEVTPAGQGALSVAVTVAFESQGAEIDGTFLEYIPAWTCDDYEIPVAECPTPGISCFLTHLGALLASLGSCADLSAWEEQEVAAGPPIDFQADLDGATLRLTLTIAPDGAGGFAVQSTMPEFDADLSLRSVAGPVDLQPLEDWIFGDVQNRLLASLEEMDLDGRIADALAPVTALTGHPRGLYLTASGRWFIETEK